MTTLLLIDTAAAHCAVAVFSGDRAIAERREDMARGHAEALFPLIGRVMAEAGVAPRDLEAVAACAGPGGFTGPRIGIAAARGLALGLGRPAVGVDWFEALAAGTAGQALVRVASPIGGWSLRRFVDARPNGPAFAARPGEAAAEPGPDEALIEGPTADLAALARAALARLAAGRPPRPSPLYLRPPDAVAATPPLAARRA